MTGWRLVQEVLPTMVEVMTRQEKSRISHHLAFTKKVGFLEKDARLLRWWCKVMESSNVGRGGERSIGGGVLATMEEGRTPRRL